MELVAWEDERQKVLEVSTKSKPSNETKEITISGSYFYNVLTQQVYRGFKNFNLLSEHYISILEIIYLQAIICVIVDVLKLISEITDQRNLQERDGDIIKVQTPSSLRSNYSNYIDLSEGNS